MLADELEEVDIVADVLVVFVDIVTLVLAEILVLALTLPLAVDRVADPLAVAVVVVVALT